MSSVKWMLQDTLMNRIGLEVEIHGERQAYCWIEFVRCFYPQGWTDQFQQWCTAKSMEKSVFSRRRNRNLAYESPLKKGDSLPMTYIDANLVPDLESKTWSIGVRGYIPGGQAPPDPYGSTIFNTAGSSKRAPSPITFDESKSVPTIDPNTFSGMSESQLAVWPPFRLSTSAADPPVSNQSSAQSSEKSSVLLAGGLMVVNGGPTKR